MSATPQTGGGRTAVIAVHGIADQRRGDTGQAVGLQLASASGGSAHMRDLPLPVARLDPAVPYRRWSPAQWAQRGLKSFRQSLRSDFLDESIGGQPGAAVQSNCATPGAATGADTGVRFTDYLLAKAQGARKRQEPEPANVSVTEVDGPQLKADVFEMHWADLSRLPGSVTRVVAELFTLVFNLSRLGVDTLSLAEKLAGPGELTWAARVQRAADWMFSRVLALLALQLVVCTLVLVPAMLVTGYPSVTQVVCAALAGVGSASALVYVWRWRWRWRWAIPAGVLIGWAVWAFVGSRYGSLGVMLAWLAGLSLVYLGFLRYCEQRFRAVLGIGIVLYLVSMACIVLFGIDAGFTGRAGWVTGTLGALEAILLAHAILWPVLALLIAATVLLSEWAIWRGRAAGRDHRQTLVTARLGLFSSVGVFLVCLMIGFMLMAWLLKALVGAESYDPWWFRIDPIATDAVQFLDQRAEQHAASFALVALLLLGLIGFVALVFTPSILREVRLTAGNSSAALGRWLTSGYFAIERLVRLWGYAVGLGAIVVALILLLAQLPRSGLMFDLGWIATQFSELRDLVRELSQDWLGVMVMGVAGGAAGLLAVGKVAIKQLQALRAPLDAALDVDNHFREFPRNAICRVLIVERFVALLDHVRQQGYERVVIIAHSQGTVITAELLRYLQQREQLADPAPAPGQVDIKALRQWLDTIGLRLLTVGSPLRQLYALRFPSMYPWMMAEVKHQDGQHWSGPQPHELGLQRWSNLWGSGDYVGRWLWSKPDGSHPPPLQVDPARYDGAVQQGQDANGRHWKDRCLGADAHTHYFELDQGPVCEELLALARP